MFGEALASQQVGTSTGRPRMVLLHGFTQTSGCWGDFGHALGAVHETLALDAPGHAASADLHGDLWRTADLAANAGGRAIYIGYSMGARIALHVALTHPDLVERLVLISGTAGIEDPAERAARRAADEALADRIESIGTDAFLDEWLTQPLFSDLPGSDHDLAERRRNSPAGLAASLREIGTGTQTPLWDRLVELRMPVLAVTGDGDRRFGALASRAVAAIGPHATWFEGRGGHAVHRQDPAVATTVLRWVVAQPDPMPIDRPIAKRTP